MTCRKPAPFDKGAKILLGIGSGSGEVRSFMGDESGINQVIVLRKYNPLCHGTGIFEKCKG